MLSETLLINFNFFLSKYYIDFGGIIVAAAVGLGIVYCLSTWRQTIATKLRMVTAKRFDNLGAIAKGLAVDTFYQKTILNCSKVRWLAHFALFWGFLGLAATTTLDEIVNPAANPLALDSPVRILGNLSGALFIIGLTMMLGRRLFSSSVRENSTKGDVLFIGLLLIVSISGFTTEIFSNLNIISVDKISYWIHIVLVAALLVTSPFSKFVHAIGRPLLSLVKRIELETRDMKSANQVK